MPFKKQPFHIYRSFGTIEVYKIGKFLRKILITESNNSQRWASKTYSILKIRQSKEKLAA